MYTAVMSRLLEPADFGLLAAAQLGLRFVTYFSLFGLASAVVQRPMLDQRDISTAMRLSIVLGVGAALITIAISPLLSVAIRDPEAAAVMQWMSLSVMIGTIVGVPEALVRRAMRFRELGAAQVASYALGYVGVGIIAATRGWGVWSLVAASIAQATSMLFLTWMICRPTIRAGYSRSTARQLLSFGGTVAITGFLEFLGGSIDTLAVGRYIGTSGLGQYSRATYLVSVPVEQATSATARVLLPSLSRVHMETDRFARAVTIMIGSLALLVAIPVAMISAAAPSLVPIVLGEGWIAAASVVPIVGVASGLVVLTQNIGVAAEASGVVRLKLKIQVGALATTSTMIVVIAVSGPTLNRLAVAWLLGEFARHAYYWRWMLPALGISRREIADRYARAALAALAAAAPIILVVRVLDDTSIGALAATVTLGLLLCAVVLWSPIGNLPRDDARMIRGNMVATSIDGK